MTPYELLSAIEEADATEPRGKGRVILELTAGRVLGVRGRPLGSDPETGVPIFGYTRAQCRRIEAIIAEAARSDLGSPG